MTTGPASSTVDLPHADDTTAHGTKATTLAALHHGGLPVLVGKVVPSGTPQEHLGQVAAELCAWARRNGHPVLVVRSSASKEDGANTSFAGLYLSRFTLAEPAAVRSALAAVRASVRAPTPQTYAMERSASGGQVMAVLVQPAVRPVAAGVVAAELAASGLTAWRIEAVRGLAEPLVAGRTVGETHSGTTLTATPATVPADQPTMVVPGTAAELATPPGDWVQAPVPGGTSPAKVDTSADGLVHLHTPPDLICTPVLPAEYRTALLRLTERAAYALKLDRIDVEWVLDAAGSITLVQARPLTVVLPPLARPGGNRSGIPAAPGVGEGPIVHLDDDLDAETVSGSVLVCEALAPDAVAVLLQRPAALISTTGGPLSHTAIIARELAIPCVTNVPDAYRTFSPGSQVQVDGTTGTITRGSTASAPRPRPNLAIAAILTTEATRHCDGTTPTVQLHEPRSPLPELIGTEGLFQATEQPPWPRRPAGYRDVTLPDLGRLLLPPQVRVPDRLVVIDLRGTVLHQRFLRSGARPQHIVWDWNGTLLDDNAASLAGINAICAAHGRPGITLDQWRATFHRPPRAAYDQLLGITLTDDEAREAADVFHTHRAQHPECGLADDAVRALNAWHASDRTQSLLSMSRHTDLITAVDARAISDYFIAVHGRDDLTTDTKAHHLTQHLAAAGVDPATTLVIGDSDDDARAAHIVGAQAILVATGTMSRTRLEATGVPVADSLTDAVQLADSCP